MVATGEAVLDRGEDLLHIYEQTGDERAFSSIVKLYRSMVFGVCLRIMRNSHDAEDATQAVFLTLAMQAKAGSNIRTLGPWLQQVAQRVSLDMYKSRKRRAAREDVRRQQTHDRFEAEEDRQISQDELRETLRLQLNELPAKYRLPMILYYFGGLTPEAIAKELGCKKKTLGVRLFRARKLLAEQLASRGVVACAAPLLLALHEVMQQGLMHSLPASGSVYAGSGAAAGLGLGFDHLSGSLTAMARALTRFTIGSKIRLAFVLIAAATAMAGYAGLIRDINLSKLPIIRSIVPKIDSVDELLRGIPKSLTPRPVSMSTEKPQNEPATRDFAVAFLPRDAVPHAVSQIAPAPCFVPTNSAVRGQALPLTSTFANELHWTQHGSNYDRVLPSPFVRASTHKQILAVSLVTSHSGQAEQDGAFASRQADVPSNGDVELASASHPAEKSMADLLADSDVGTGSNQLASADQCIASSAGLLMGDTADLSPTFIATTGEGRLAYASADGVDHVIRSTFMAPPTATGTITGVIPEPASMALIVCLSAFLLGRRTRDDR